ncbi:MAG: hypothetical protein ACJ8GN_16495, partial [Longimicrobiaceae bacterium]
MGLFARLHDEGQTIIMVTHEPDIAAHAERVVMLRDGVIESDRTQVPVPAGTEWIGARAAETRAAETAAALSPG